MSTSGYSFGTDIIGFALNEDVGSGDLTSRFFIDPTRMSHGRIFAKEAAVVAGSDVAAAVFKRVNPAIEVEVLLEPGCAVLAGESVLRFHGPTHSLLTAERTALNFLQRLSGVATLTRRYVDAAYPVRVLDTRKTTPGLRVLEKAAVLAGGGTNHRMGLHDMVMVKDNHLLASGNDASLLQCIQELKKAHPEVRVELEADTLDQVLRFLKITGVDVILLDNMPLEILREAVGAGRGSGIQFEASGGVTLERIPEIAATGVDFISVGALTHSAGAIDFSLELTGIQEGANV